MNIYVDFDDCLCETGKAFSRLVSEMFGKDVPYEAMQSFNLQETFRLKDEEYRQLLIKGHEPETLLSYEETPGASTVINEWMGCGHEVSIITGRPSVAYEASRAWLDQHDLKAVRLYCLDKYDREKYVKSSGTRLKLEDYYKMKFDFAVEDSAAAFRFFDHLPDLQVMVFDRPWNQNCAFPGANYTRCVSWENIRANVQKVLR